MSEPTSRNEEQSVLVQQGGGASGAYQAGAYECLAEHIGGIDWVAGISFGSINAAIIAGNAPELRVTRIRQLWERVASRNVTTPMFNNGWMRALINESSSAATTLPPIITIFAYSR